MAVASDKSRKKPQSFSFAITREEEVEPLFAGQLERCGVDYFDYYLLHNVTWMRYTQIIKEAHLFDHMKRWKEQGKLRHIAISYHDTADVLDQILTEHPEIEAVQIALNYFDWDARLIQARKCYETIRKHGKLAIVMEPVKGGMLAKVPAEAERRMRELRPEDSAVSWALRFAAGLDGVLAVLSGMSNTAQMEDNVSTFQRFQPLTEAEREALSRTARLYRESGPAATADFAPMKLSLPGGSARRTFWTPGTPACSSQTPPSVQRATTSPARKRSAASTKPAAASPAQRSCRTARM